LSKTIISEKSKHSPDPLPVPKSSPQDSVLLLHDQQSVFLEFPQSVLTRILMYEHSSLKHHVFWVARPMVAHVSSNALWPQLWGNHHVPLRSQNALHGHHIAWKGQRPKVGVEPGRPL
jgi:hypothetical protein